MKFCVLASGSGGNACYFETKKAKVLVDAGLSCREIERRLCLIGVQPISLDALIITHEHTDHIKGAGAIARRFDLPVYVNRKTLERGRKALGKLPRPMIVETGQALAINDMGIDTFTKCHDAVDPMGLVLYRMDGPSVVNGARVGLATDLGRSTSLVEDRLKDCQALIMEFNYDQTMLHEGPYPLDLKRRIKGPEGHLSNKQAADLLRAVSHGGLKHLVLAHLSETNNHPDKAYQQASDILYGLRIKGATISVSLQHEPGPVFSL